MTTQAARRESWRSFKIATWLGWQIESNWTDPFLFIVYSIVKPLAAASILVVMYAVITQANFANPLFPYIYLGNAFYGYVGSIMVGVSWAIIDDREHYRTLKYMYMAPIRVPAYLLGRGMARFLTTTFSVFVTILFGVLFLQIPIRLSQIDWPLFLIALVIGVVMLAMLGLLLAGITMQIVRHEGFLGEAVAGALYIFSGAIFPLEVLPAWLRPVGFAMPVTYWLELMRRALVGEVAQAFPTLAGFSNLELLAILLGLSLLFGGIAFRIFKWCELRAREKGLIDRTTNY